MYKKFLFVAITLFFSSIAFSQEVEDKVKTSGGEGTLNFANTGFSDYWAGGGLGSTTINGLFNSYLNTKYENGSTWDNNLRLDYGIAKVDNTNGDNFTKSSDVLDFISKYGKPLKSSDVWYYSAAFNVLSQLTNTRTAWGDNGYTSLIGINNNPDSQTFGNNQSGFMSPGDISLGIGFDYKPNDNFTAFIGPLSTKLRVVAKDEIAQSGLFGNEVTIDNNNMITNDFDNTRLEAGANVIANYNNRFLTNDMLSFSTGLKLFSNYLEDPQNVDVNWNTVTALNPWKFITLTYSTDLAYDDNKQFTSFSDGQEIGAVKKGMQFRNVFGIGLTHKLGDSK